MKRIVTQRDFDRFAATHLQQPSRPGVEEVLAAEISVLDAAGEAQPLGEHRTAEILTAALRPAVLFGASDVHFEPGETAGQIRVRRPDSSYS